jgi:hypothetical protein
LHWTETGEDRQKVKAVQEIEVNKAAYIEVRLNLSEGLAD